MGHQIIKQPDGWEEAVANDKASTTVGFGDDLDKEWP